MKYSYKQFYFRLMLACTNNIFLQTMFSTMMEKNKKNQNGRSFSKPYDKKTFENGSDMMESRPAYRKFRSKSRRARTDSSSSNDLQFNQKPNGIERKQHARAKHGNRKLKTERSKNLQKMLKDQLVVARLNDETQMDTIYRPKMNAPRNTNDFLIKDYFYANSSADCGTSSSSEKDELSFIELPSDEEHAFSKLDSLGHESFEKEIQDFEQALTNLKYMVEKEKSMISRMEEIDNLKSLSSSLEQENQKLKSVPEEPAENQLKLWSLLTTGTFSNYWLFWPQTYFCKNWAGQQHIKHWKKIYYTGILIATKCNANCLYWCLAFICCRLSLMRAQIAAPSQWRLGWWST